MPELKGKTFPDFVETTVDTETIRYKDKNREKHRQKMLAELKTREKIQFSKNNVKNKAWSKQTSKKERRQKRAAKRSRHEVFSSCSKSATNSKEPGLEMSFFICRVDLQGSDIDEEGLEELLNDTRLLKKLKKGQISAEDFDKQIATEQKNKDKAAGPSHEDEDEWRSSWCPVWTCERATEHNTRSARLPFVGGLYCHWWGTHK